MAITTLIERARRYAAECAVAVSGQRGHDATLHVAAVLWNVRPRLARPLGAYRRSGLEVPLLLKQPR